jgi:hypothetical protein
MCSHDVFGVHRVETAGLLNLHCPGAWPYCFSGLGSDKFAASKVSKQLGQVESERECVCV